MKKQLQGVSMRMEAIIEFIDEHTADEVDAEELILENLHPDFKFAGREQNINDMKVMLDLFKKHEPTIIYQTREKHHEDN